jgi:hypothetical protein
MKQRRYRVSLVGFDDPAPPKHRLSPIVRRSRRILSGFWAQSWKLRTAMLCVVVGCIVLVWGFS